MTPKMPLACEKNAARLRLQFGKEAGSGSIELQISKTTRQQRDRARFTTSSLWRLPSQQQLLLLFATSISSGRSTTSPLTIKHILTIVVTRCPGSDNKFSRRSRARLHWRRVARCKVRCQLPNDKTIVNARHIRRDVFSSLRNSLHIDRKREREQKFDRKARNVTFANAAIIYRTKSLTNDIRKQKIPHSRVSVT